jgi:hypothetical protein
MGSASDAQPFSSRFYDGASLETGPIFDRDFLYKPFSPVQWACSLVPMAPSTSYGTLIEPIAPPRPHKSCYGRCCVPHPRETARMGTQ